MRQVGVLAAAGLVALDLRDRLGEDHAHADVFRAALQSVSGVDVLPGGTNIVVARVAPRDAPTVVGELGARGVLANAMDADTLRLVTHRDVSEDDCRRAAQVVLEVLGRA
jgi:threonine aldolase